MVKNRVDSMFKSVSDCPNGSEPIYDGDSDIIIGCSSNTNPFENADGFGSTINNTAPSSTPLDYVNYDSGQADGFGEAQQIFTTKYNELMESIPSFWNYLLVLGLIILLGIMIFSFRKSSNNNGGSGR